MLGAVIGDIIGSRFVESAKTLYTCLFNLSRIKIGIT